MQDTPKTCGRSHPQPYCCCEQCTRAARGWRIGARVTCPQEPDVCGTVSEIGYLGIKVAWDDGQIQILHYDDTEGAVARL